MILENKHFKQKNMPINHYLAAAKVYGRFSTKSSFPLSDKLAKAVQSEQIAHMLPHTSRRTGYLGKI